MSSSAKVDSPKLVVIDGNGLAYRAFYALPPLKTSQGEPVNAVYGFTNMLLKIIDKEKPDYIAVAFDKSKPVKRLEQFEEYKANRQKMPEELQKQFPIIEEVVQAFNIPTFYKEGYEADDCIATIVSKAEKEGIHTRIYSGDLDMLQLVSDKAEVVTTRRGISDLVVYDPQMVRKRYGIEPPQMVDYKALAGDSSDHIPGIPGIGEASASKLLNQFKSIEDMYERADKIPSRWRKQILENKEQAFLSKRLVTLERNLDFNFNWDDLKLKSPERDKLKELLIRLEFKSLLKKLGFKEEEVQEIQEIVVQIVGKDEDLDIMLDRLKAAGEFSLHWISDEERNLVGLAIAEGTSNGYYFPFALPEQLNISSTFGISTFSQERVFHELRSLIESKEVKKYVYDLKDGIKYMKRGEYFTGNNFMDILIATSLIEPDNANLSLEAILERYTGFKAKPLSEIVGTGKGKKKMKIIEVPLQDLTLFMAGRAVRINNLAPNIAKKLEEKGLTNVFENIEIPLTPLLSAMEEQGIKIDVSALKEEEKKIKSQIEEISSEIYQIVGHQFNINSPKQVGKVLFEELNLPAVKHGSSYRTGADVLQKLLDVHPVIEKILRYKEIHKIKSNHIDAIMSMLDLSTAKIYPKYRQIGTTTGKITSTPNFKAIPAFLRHIFIPAGEDKILLSFEMENLELFILAHFSKDESFISDITSPTPLENIAKRIFAKEDIGESEKQGAHKILYSIINGQTPHSLAQKMGWKRNETKKYIERCLRVYPKINEFIQNSIKKVEEEGRVSTIYGRWKEIAGINSENRNIRQSSQRSLISHLINGSWADIVKKCMVDVFEKVLRSHRDIHLMIPYESMLIFEVRKRRLERYAGLIKEILLESFPLDVPPRIIIKSGDNWGSLMELK